MTGPANVSHPPGTLASPPALSDWRAIYLSASTSTPALPNPSFFSRGHGQHSQPNHSQIHQGGGSRRHLGAQEQVSALNDCNHLLTATKPDKHCHYYGMRVCVLTVRCGCINISFPLHTAMKGNIMFITCSLLHPQHICVLSVVTSGCDFTALFSLWLSSPLFTQLLKLKKKEQHKPLPQPLTLVCLSCASLELSHTHHNNTSGWLNVWLTV